MTEHEALLVCRGLQTMIPQDTGIVLTVEPVEDRYVVAGPGIHIDYPWQYLELRLTGLAQMLAAMQRPHIELAGTLPAGLVRG